MLLDYQINDVAPYINWDYFFYAWGMHNKPEAEKAKLRGEAEETLATLRSRYRTHAVFQLFEANSEGDDIVIGERRIPLLRQQQSDAESLCLADFIRPLSSGKKDKIGVFATSVDMGLETDFDHDTYQKMMVQLLADRLAEATAERMHEEVRKNYWGYAPDEQLTMQELHIEIDELIGMRQIGIRLTESGAMKPHASVSGLMMAHPKARYFAIGKIGNDQLEDYAHRRGLPVEVMRKFLSTNL